MKHVLQVISYGKRHWKNFPSEVFENIGSGQYIYYPELSQSLLKIEFIYRSLDKDGFIVYNVEHDVNPHVLFVLGFTESKK